MENELNKWILIETSDAVTSICPHCKTRWVWKGENWSAAIKRIGNACACPRNWRCAVCSKPITNPIDFLEYEKNGAHVECTRQELYGKYILPTCESCGDELTVHDPQPLTDGHPLLCMKCEKIQTT